MLYSLYEAQHAWLTPFRLLAEAQRGWLTNPFMPWADAPLARKLAASNDLFLRVTHRYEKPEWRIPEARIELAADKPFCKLLHFTPVAPRPHPVPKILVVAPLSGHHATLLRDTVRTLLARPRGLHHRLDRRAHGAARATGRSTSTTTSTTCRSSSGYLGARACT